MAIDKQKHRDFKSIVDKIFWEEWDPIGVNDCLEARDEYTSYASIVCGKLWNGESKKNILDYMYWVVSEHMGLGGDKRKIDEENGKIIDKVIAIFASYQG